MKKQGHPHYQDVLFIDTATGDRFVCGSTLKPTEKEVFEGKEYPAYKVSISSASHPFFTGSQQLVDSEGRVDKFRKRYSAKPAAAPVEAVAVEEKKKPSAAKKAPVKKAK